jgi:hypothetical protein
MTQRNIKSIVAAIALGAPMMIFGFVQVAPYSPDYLAPRSHGFANGVTNVACAWVTDDRGNTYCVGIDEQERYVSPRR